MMQKTCSSDVVVVIHLNKVNEAVRADMVDGLVDEIKKRFEDCEPTRRSLAFGDLVIDVDRREVIRGAERIHLSPMECALLEYLVLHRNRVISEERLMRDLFPTAKAARQFNTLWVHLHRLRKKIDTNASDRLIHTIRGGGYLLRSPAEEQAVVAPDLIAS